MTISSTDSNNSNNNWLNQGKRVVLQGLLAAAHLNGREGVVISDQIIKASGRYEVQLSSLSDDADGGGEIKSVKVKPANLMPLEGASDDDAAADAAPLALAETAAAPTNKKYRPKAYLSARPGAYKASYDWRAVLPDQPIPRGMEVLMALTTSDSSTNSDITNNDKDDEPTLARIPRSWKLDVRVLKEGTTSKSSYEMVRCEVERTTSMAGVTTAVLAGMRQKNVVSNDDKNITLVLFVDDDPWRGGDDATVETAMLFGKQVSCRYTV